MSGDSLDYTIIDGGTSGFERMDHAESRGLRSVPHLSATVRGGQGCGDACLRFEGCSDHRCWCGWKRALTHTAHCWGRWVIMKRT